MYTRCPTCSTCFRVTDRHLAIANGKVRCGQCKLVFNAPEHAIDDLPVNQLTEKKTHQPIPPVAPTPPPKIEIKKVSPPPQVKKIVPAAIAPTAKEKREKTSVDEPIFDANATVIADMGAVNKDELDDIDLDISHRDTSTKEQNELDDVFNNDVDLDAAIDQLTRATEDAIKEEDHDIEDEVPIAEIINDYFEPDNNGADVFTTDAYDATRASSVEDILSEMEGQLSLDISEPKQPNLKDEIEYDANNEFDFIQLDDEDTDSINIDEEQSETNDDTLKKHFNLDEFNLDEETDALIEENKEDDLERETSNTENGEGKHFNLDEFDIDEELDALIEKNKEDELERETSSNEDGEEKHIDADELFNQIDISDFQDSEIEDDITLEETSSAKSDFTNHSDETDVPFQLRNDIGNLQTPPQRRIHPLISFSFFIFLLVLSFSQLAYFQSHALLNAIPEARPLLVQFCEKIGCQYSGPTDKKKIQLISRDVRLHPKEKKALLISAAMINNANFAQPYPNIHIRLSDISGNVIAERIFSAKTYMGKISSPFLLMKSKTPVHINFEVVDPGKDAINFEFTFL